MATLLADIKISSIAAGFTLGFGFLTAWTAIKQTRNTSSPARSAYIWMIWGELVVNLTMVFMALLFLYGYIPPGIPSLFAMLFLWVFQIQLVMQIIINRIYVVAENKQQVIRVKWGTAIFITVINIMVFCIWIPAHLVPPVSETYVRVNKYWDPTSKVLICIVDSALNIWFIRIVRQHLVRHCNLAKYAPLARFNSYLLVVSICMDVMLIGLMFLKNPLVYIQFHPVSYIVKLNIEMSVASLITKLARQSIDPNINEYMATHSSSQPKHTTAATGASACHNSSVGYPLQALRRDNLRDAGNKHQVLLGRHHPAGRTSESKVWDDDDFIPLQNGSSNC